MAKEDEYVIDWETLPEDEDGIAYVQIDGDRYRLPYLELIPQNVSAESLRSSIEEDGIEYPIIVDEENNVIDGMTRLYLAKDLGLSSQEVPIKRANFDEREDGWEKAIELNAVRRQLSASMRRELIREIVSRKNWRKPSIHVSDLARLLGVHKSTISRDLDQIYGDEQEQELKKRKRTLNISLTGMRNVSRLIEAEKILEHVSQDEKADYRKTLDELIAQVEEERAFLNERLSNENSGETAA